MKDRRIKKTEESIQSAFANLLSEKLMENITVKNLCEVANINKSTFYLHYKDIYDCADCFRDDIIYEIDKVFSQYNFGGIIDNFPIILENIMNIFETNKELYMPFLKSPSLSPTLCKMKQLIIDKVLNRLDEKDDVIQQCIVSFVISGIISLLEQNDFAQISKKTILALADKIQHGFTC